MTDLSRVQLTQTQDWCYHEGSYGYNPEYGATHIKTDYNDGSNVNKTAEAGVTTFWEIYTSGQADVPEERSPTGAIGHTHSVKLEGDTLTVTVNYAETGETKTQQLSVAELYRQFVAGGSVKKLQYAL